MIATLPPMVSITSTPEYKRMMAEKKADAMQLIRERYDRGMKISRERYARSHEIYERMDRSKAEAPHGLEVFRADELNTRRLEHVRSALLTRFIRNPNTKNPTGADVIMVLSIAMRTQRGIAYRFRFIRDPRKSKDWTRVG